MPHAIELPALQFEDLPRELIEEILSLMPTKNLVVASRTSKLIHDIATYIINRRLRHTLQVEGYKPIFECYTADDQSNHPYTQCEYTGTHSGAEDSTETANKLKKIPAYFSEADEEECNPVAGLYSHFTPKSYGTPTPSTTVTIDSGDLFTQVCASASLIKVAQSSSHSYGALQSVIPVFESFFRAKRDWLDNAYACEGQIPIVWVGMGENMGLKLKVNSRKVVGPAVSGGVRGRDQEGEAVEYGVEYESLVIRSTYLLEMVEKKQHASFFQNLSLVAETVPMPAMDATVVAY